MARAPVQRIHGLLDTPDLVGAIWVGYDKTDSDHYVPGGSQITTTMFRDIMKKRTQIQLKKHFSYRSYLRLIIKQLTTIEEENEEEEEKKKEEEQQRKQEQQEWLDKVKEWIPSFW